MAEGRFYGPQDFRPSHIVSQMVVLQSCFYLTFSVLQWSAFSLFQLPSTPRNLFNWQKYAFRDQYGTAVNVVFLSVCLAMAPIVAVVVERAKKCLDFVCTYHSFHCLFTWLHSGFPKSGAFWAVHLAGVVLTTFLSEWICFQNEAQEIRLNRGSIVSTTAGGGRRQETCDNITVLNSNTIVGKGAVPAVGNPASITAGGYAESGTTSTIAGAAMLNTTAGATTTTSVSTSPVTSSSVHTHYYKANGITATSYGNATYHNNINYDVEMISRSRLTSGHRITIPPATTATSVVVGKQHNAGGPPQNNV
eukprot:Lankesteria_metandrocarpae@DN2063_c0_g1_i1.p1